MAISGRRIGTGLVGLAGAFLCAQQGGHHHHRHRHGGTSSAAAIATRGGPADAGNADAGADVSPPESAAVAALRSAAAVPMSADFAISVDRAAQEGDRSAVPILIEALGRVTGASSIANQSRVSIARALGRIGDADGVPALVRLLGADPAEQDLLVHRTAALALGRIGDPRAAEPLAHALFVTRRGESIQPAVRIAICGLGPAATAPLARIVRGHDAALLARAERAMILPSVLAQTAAEALGGADDPHAVGALREGLGGADPMVAASAALALGSIGRDAIIRDLLVAALGRGTAASRAGAVAGLERLADPRSTGALLALARAEAPSGGDLGPRAARAYARLADPAGAADLGALLPAFSSGRDDVSGSLRLLRSAAPCGRDVACHLRALEGPDDLAREKAAWMLAVLGVTNGPVLAALAARAGDSSIDVREAALAALDRLGAPGCAACADRIEEQVAREEFEHAFEGVNREALCVAAHLRRRAR